MWGWFKGQKRPKESPTTVEERVVALEGELRGMKLEWVNTFEQLTRIAGRIDASKRWLAERASQAPTPAAIEAPAGTQELIQDVSAPPGDEGTQRPTTRRQLLANLVSK